MAKRYLGALLVFAFIVTGLGACANVKAAAPGNGQEPRSGTVAVTNGSYGEIDPTGLAGMLRHKDFELVNVHIPYAGEIAGTDAFVPYDQIAGNLARLPADRNASIVLYCRSGMMSGIAARTLVKLGYKNIWSLKGGMAAWQQAGNPLLQQSATPAAQPAPNDTGGTLSSKGAGASLPAETRTNNEGGVTVQITPPGTAGDELVFSVSLNTHSVDLTYDFRALATLRDDQGHAYAAAGWDGGSGGHHLTGKLVFSNNPPVTKPGAKWVELELKDIAGVSVRTFRWDVGSGGSSA
jgi:rhodanese-related sulfurtransferase